MHPSGKLRSVKRFCCLGLLCALVLPLTAVAADDLVRVEILVFKYTNGQSDAWPVDRLEDFSALPDPRRRALLAAWTARYRELVDEEDAPEALPQEQWDQASPDLEPNLDLAPDPTDSSLPEGLLFADPLPSAPAAAAVRPINDALHGPVWPELLVQQPGLSSSMQRAYNRLRNSPNHEVLSATNWLQVLDRGTPSPAVRVRDDSPLSVAWLNPPAAPFSIDETLTHPLQMPESIYRLDGSVRIRQRQFRHADLDLIWSQRRPQALMIAPTDSAAYEIHRMRLSRPIQLGRMEYFDSPWLGVLILVEPWQPPAP